MIRGDSSEGVYSINHLYPLELSSLSEQSDRSASNDERKETITRPSRAAAAVCRDKLRFIV